MMAISSSSAHDKTSLLIEGWRGLNHSYSLINQHQILEFMQIPSLRLFHHDLPYFNPGWSRDRNGSHFPDAIQSLIDAIPAANGQKIDCVYRAGFPFICGDATDHRRTLTFMVTEFGLSPSGFATAAGDAGAPDLAFLTRGSNMIVTPSNWARDRIADYGFASSHIAVVPHGVDRAVFYPMDAENRKAVRDKLGIGEDEVVFLNIGGALWNKGADVLLRAFAALRHSGVKARLLFKDQSGLYGVKIHQTISETATTCPQLLEPDTISAISVISDNLSNDSLRELYNLADCYVSPYRAEGFNLPVLEAIACALPVIVTAGGATDDFCSDGVAVRIPGALQDLDRQTHGATGRYIEPDLGALIAAMTNFAKGVRLDPARFRAEREAVLNRCSWRNAALQLANLAANHPIAGASDNKSTPMRVEPVTQQDLLDLLIMIQPRSCSGMRMVRIGNDYDGGYVMPSRGLKSDLVVSIGVGPDVSFDLALARGGAQILQFDHTVAESPAQHPNFKFYPMGWGATRTENMLSFADINTLVQAHHAKHPMLKFDIEGGEYEALTATDAEDLRAYDVIVCEFHGFENLADPDFFRTAWNVLSKLTHAHVPVHLHANNYGGMSLVLGVPLPRVLELSFLRRDLTDVITLATEKIPGPLDRPNNPTIPDLVLTPFS